MSVNLSSYIDYSEWSNDWKRFIEFFLRVEGIKSKDELWTKMDFLIKEYDPLLWGSYRKGDMSDISYEEHNFQLAYLLRYYALYSKTIEYIATRSNFLEDIPISIAGVGFADDYEGDLGSRRTIIYTLDFEMRTNFYGNIPTSKIIRKSVAKIFNPRVGFTDPARGLNVDSDVRLQTVQIDPNPITTIGDPDSDFGFTTTIWGQDSDGGFGS